MTALRLPRSLRAAPTASPTANHLEDAAPPLSENDLAREIARIMDRRPLGPAQEASPAPARWLGHEHDAARVAAACAVDLEPGSPSARLPDTPATGALQDVDDTPLDTLGAADTAQWVRKARRQRLYARMRDAAGWTISLGVALILVAAIGIAMLGWPTAPPNVEQLRVRAITLSDAIAHQSRAAASRTDAHAPTERLVSAR